MTELDCIAYRILLLLRVLSINISGCYVLRLHGRIHLACFELGGFAWSVYSDSCVSPYQGSSLHHVEQKVVRGLVCDPQVPHKVPSVLQRLCIRKSGV
jgi:hypothetical protein